MLLWCGINDNDEGNALKFPYGLGRTSWRSPTSCLKVCRRRLQMLLVRHLNRPRDLSPGKFLEGLVGHHFLQWDEEIVHARRKPGHQFRCQSEYLFATRRAKVGWTGWCEPTPALKAFKGEATSLASEISTWRDLRDVALEFQIRTGEPATIHYVASVLRLPVKITRSMFLDSLTVHMRRRMNLQRTVDFVFYKGRIWPEGSQLELEISHCDTFAVMSNKGVEQTERTPVLLEEASFLNTPFRPRMNGR